MSQLRSKESAKAPPPENSLAGGGSFERNSYRVTALGWLKKERWLNNSDFWPLSERNKSKRLGTSDRGNHSSRGVTGDWPFCHAPTSIYRIFVNLYHPILARAVMCTDEWLPTVFPAKKRRCLSRSHAQNVAQIDHPQSFWWLFRTQHVYIGLWR